MSANWSNRTLWTSDNLDIMRGMNSASVDLIYLDPPFNSKANYGAPIGSKAAGAAFKDTWALSDVDAEWINLIEAKHPALHRVLLAATTNSDKSYLAYMAARILEMRRLLKPTGSIYLHCDPTMSHYLKIVMDAIFGRKRFLNEILWLYKTGGTSKRWFGRKHDDILLYARTKEYTFNQLKEKSYLSHRYGFSNVEILEDQHGTYTFVGMRDYWAIPALRGNQPETVGYPTQKPLALLDRIIKASSNEGDMVLDPFAGCATACVAAEHLYRDWVGIDLSPLAAKLVKQRLRSDVGELLHEVHHREDIPRRTDLGKLPKYNGPKNRSKLYGEQEGNCAGCDTHFEARHLEVDHIISRNKGGTDHIENLQLLCGSCNRIKGDRGMEYLRVKLQL